MTAAPAVAPLDTPLADMETAMQTDQTAPLHLAEDLEVTELALEDAACTPACHCGAQAEATTPTSPRINFALWDNGELTVDDGELVMLLPAQATLRLARLLSSNRLEALCA